MTSNGKQSGRPGDLQDAEGIMAAIERAVDELDRHLLSVRSDLVDRNEQHEPDTGFGEP
jgi:hypothetical protein